MTKKAITREQLSKALKRWDIISNMIFELHWGKKTKRFNFAMYLPELRVFLRYIEKIFKTTKNGIKEEMGIAFYRYPKFIEEIEPFFTIPEFIIIYQEMYDVYEAYTEIKSQIPELSKLHGEAEVAYLTNYSEQIKEAIYDLL